MRTHSVARVNYTKYILIISRDVQTTMCKRISRRALRRANQTTHKKIRHDPHRCWSRRTHRWVPKWKQTPLFPRVRRRRSVTIFNITPAGRHCRLASEYGYGWGGWEPRDVIETVVVCISDRECAPMIYECLITGGRSVMSVAVCGGNCEARKRVFVCGDKKKMDAPCWV